MSAKPASTPRPSKTDPAPRAPRQEQPKRVRKDVRVDPFSKWQKLVSSRMHELGLSTRALTAKIHTATWAPKHTTIWAWIRSKEGYPPRDAYTDAVNSRLAKALEIEPSVLATAYEDSRRHLVMATDTGQRGQLSVLRTLFFESSRKTWTKQEIISLIDQVQGH